MNLYELDNKAQNKASEQVLALTKEETLNV